MKDEFSKQPLSTVDKTRFPEYYVESISQKGICGVEKLLGETEKRETVTEIRDKITIQAQRRVREEKLNTRESNFTHIQGSDIQNYDEQAKVEAEKIRKELLENNWLGEEHEGKREDRQVAMMKSTQEYEDRSDKACSTYIGWMRETVDQGLQAVIQKNIKAYPMDKVKQIKEAEKEIAQLMRGDVTITRTNIKQQIENVGMMEQMDDVMERMEEFTKLRRQLLQSHEMYGGDIVMREYDYKTFFEKRLGMNDPDTVRMRNVLEVMPDTTAWEEIVERVTGIIEKAKIHTGINRQGQKSSSVNQAQKQDYDEMGRLTKKVNMLAKTVLQEKEIRKRGGANTTRAGGGNTTREGEKRTPWDFDDEAYKQGICFFYLKGTCRRGKDCKFKHDQLKKKTGSQVRSPSVASTGSATSKASGSVSSGDSRLTNPTAKKKLK
jgi:hypothetical protein